MSAQEARAVDVLTERVLLSAPSPGVRYVRHHRAVAMHAKKTEARSWLLGQLGRREWPKSLSIMTMPGMFWDFERILLSKRETAAKLNDKTKQTGNTRRTFITALEREASVYTAALKHIPGGKSFIGTRPTAPFATYSISTPLVTRFHLATVEDVLEQYEYPVDVSWLDFNGQLTERRVAGFRRFWPLVRSTLVVTFLGARQTRSITEQLRQGVGALFTDICPGSKVVHLSRYSDGSPMVQVALKREARD